MILRQIMIRQIQNAMHAANRRPALPPIIEYPQRKLSGEIKRSEEPKERGWSKLQRRLQEAVNLIVKEGEENLDENLTQLKADCDAAKKWIKQKEENGYDVGKINVWKRNFIPYLDYLIKILETFKQDKKLLIAELKQLRKQYNKTDAKVLQSCPNPAPQRYGQFHKIVPDVSGKSATATQKTGAEKKDEGHVELSKIQTYGA